MKKTLIAVIRFEENAEGVTVERAEIQVWDSNDEMVIGGNKAIELSKDIINKIKKDDCC